MPTPLAISGEPPAIRRQRDNRQQYWSQRSGINFEGSEDKARQEYKDEADVNNILSRFGVNVPLRQNGVYREVDWDLDLQQAVEAVNTLDRVMPTLPPSLRERYPTWGALLNDVRSGKLKINLDTARPEEKTVGDKKPSPKVDGNSEQD